MKTLANATSKLVLLLLSFLSPVILLAQEGGTKIDVDINKDEGGSWYTSPIVWLVGAAIFILLLVALLPR